MVATGAMSSKAISFSPYGRGKHHPTTFGRQLLLWWGSAVGRFAGDAAERGLERAGGEQGAGGLGQQAPGDAAAGADGHGGVDLAAAAGGVPQLVGDVHRDRPARAERDAGLVS